MKFNNYNSKLLYFFSDGSASYFRNNLSNCNSFFIFNKIDYRLYKNKNNFNNINESNKNLTEYRKIYFSINK